MNDSHHSAVLRQLRVRVPHIARAGGSTSLPSISIFDSKRTLGVSAMPLPFFRSVDRWRMENRKPETGNGKPGIVDLRTSVFHFRFSISGLRFLIFLGIETGRCRW